MHCRPRISIIVLLFGIMIAIPGMSLRAQSDDTDVDVPISNAHLHEATLQQNQGRIALLAEIQAGTTSDELWPNLAALGAEELYRTQTSLIYRHGAIAFLVNARNSDAVARIPGVRAVHPLLAKEVLDTLNTDAVTPAAIERNFPRGATGQDVRIGVIDSGIDYTHATFGGGSSPQAYNNNNPRRIESGSFPTAKIVGGYDFAGDSYDITNTPVPVPDADPLDCRGYGTHSASTIAGFGVNPQGRTYTGPYNASADFAAFPVGPGVAPEAQLYALKVLGCSPSRGTMLLLPAIEYALDPNGDGNSNDRLDVLMISLGAPFGGTDDPDFVAVEAAVAAGMVVVVGAGNFGNPVSPEVTDNGSAFYAVQSPGSVDGAISVAAINTTNTLTPTLFSNLGPAFGNRAVKPDLAAPGVGIGAAAFGSGSNAAVSTGTSSAAASVAGAASLLSQLYPEWSATQIKAALVNTAAPLQNVDRYALTRTGLGELDITRAANTTLIAYATEAPAAVGLNFGRARVTDTIERRRNLTIENLSNQPQQIRINTASGDGPGLPNPGLTVSPEFETTTIPAGSTQTVDVQATIDGRELTRVRDPLIPQTQNGVARHYLSEQSGTLTIASDAGQQRAIRVPYAMFAQTASNASIANDTLDVPGGIGVALATVQNTSVRDYDTDQTYRPILSAFELMYRSQDEPGSTDSINAADLRYVGVSSNYNLVNRNLARTDVFFGIATHRPWFTPNEVQFEVWIDINRDGTFDRVLTSSSLGEATQVGRPNDVFLSPLVSSDPASPLANPSFSFVNGFTAPIQQQRSGQDTAPFNSSVLFMVADAELLAHNQQANFRYQIRSYHRNAGNFSSMKLVDQTPILQYNATRPAIDVTNPRNPPGGNRFAETPIYLSTNGSPVFVRVRGDWITSSDRSGLLVLFHHNPPNRQAQIVPIDAGFVDPVTIAREDMVDQPSQSPIPAEVDEKLLRLNEELLERTLQDQDAILLPIIQ